MDKEGKTPSPTEAARIEKGIWRIEYKAVHYDERVSSERKNEDGILIPIGLHTARNIKGGFAPLTLLTGFRNVSIIGNFRSFILFTPFSYRI